MMRWVRLPVWVAAVLCLMTGCASHQKENYLKDRAVEHVYKQPLSEIWPRVKAVIDDQGYYFEEEKSPEGYVLQTDWKETDKGSGLASSYTRMLVEGKEEKGKGSTLQVLRVDVSSRQVLVNPASSSFTGAQSAMIDSAHRQLMIQNEVWKHADRDSGMEWELLKAIDPEAAAALEKDAAAKFPK
ncbi:MAG: hypothetical protein ACJ8AT_14375 [Hyalangium sp.]|uniref:hypothetical protein n=1 Tax=Hyalangium sp. TaxID=2028555 RepID=UPI00389A449A